MSDTIGKEKRRSFLKRLRIQNRQDGLQAIVYSVLGALLYLVVVMIPMPFTMVSLLKFGLAPALSVIAIAGAIRGPIVGLLTGYLGEVMHGLILSGGAIAATLPALAYGMMGFFVGLAQYDFARGRSLAKLSLVAAGSFLLTAVLLLAVNLFVENLGTLAAIGFVFLPLATVGLPSVVLLSPIYGGLWHLIEFAIRPHL